eukprot:SAG22_NODE_276_length_13167_cov_8.415825_9_plen_79_part_00
MTLYCAGHGSLASASASLHADSSHRTVEAGGLTVACLCPTSGLAPAFVSHLCSRGHGYLALVKLVKRGESQQRTGQSK